MSRYKILECKWSAKVGSCYINSLSRWEPAPRLPLDYFKKLYYGTPILCMPANHCVSSHNGDTFVSHSL